MKIKNISFITPMKEIEDKKIVLEKSYSQEYQLLKGESISLSSNIGKRETQQDSIAIAQNGDYLLLLVADGIGGMSNGEIASYTTAKIIKKWFESEDKESLKIITKKNLEDVLNALMYLISTNIPGYSGSTLNMSIICPNETFIINIGDSRTYTIKDGQITLRTIDDSIAFKTHRPKNSRERDELRFFKTSNIITNSIVKDVFPVITITRILNQDYDILCHVTDGITDYLSEHLIETFLKMKKPALTLVNKSIDNITLYSHMNHPQFHKCIYPGEDNATAIVYTKKKIKNN